MKRIIFLFLILGSVAVIAYAAQNQLEITKDAGYMYVKSNGIPDHSYGRFPNSGNPNSVSEQDHEYRITLHPKLSGRTTDLKRGIFGVAVNGVPFERGTAETWNGDRNWSYEALSGSIDLGTDQNNAHVQPTGMYHYHGLPTGIIQGQSSIEHSMLVGFAADGFPIYAQYGYSDAEDAASKIKKLKSSYRIKSGRRSGGPGGNYDGTFVQDYEYRQDLGDLDECNGRYGVTPQFSKGIYHYFLTEDYPFIPRCFKGTPDSSFEKKPHGGRGGHPGSRQGLPPGRRPPPRF